jgi:uncharacterized protein (UPF0248 family)
MEVLPRKKIMEMNLIVDERDWGAASAHPVAFPAEDSGNLRVEGAPTSSRPPRKSRSSERSGLSFLRPAQDVISRINWDPSLSAEAFVIGYEDRFVGVKEIELEKWKSEATDEEFIPMHRIVWIRRKGDNGGEIVWDRKKKVDLVFGSGFS